MDKGSLLAQMNENLRVVARLARHASEDAEIEARTGATPGEKSLDARVAIEYSLMAKAQAERARLAQQSLATLERFRPGALGPRDRITIGAVVEIEDEDTGVGRTFFLAPVGAGMNLTGPDGDGHITVVTPASPVGRAVRGRFVGEVVDVTIDGSLREWRIAYAC